MSSFSHYLEHSQPHLMIPKISIRPKKTAERQTKRATTTVIKFVLQVDYFILTFGFELDRF